MLLAATCIIVTPAFYRFFQFLFPPRASLQACYWILCLCSVFNMIVIYQTPNILMFLSHLISSHLNIFLFVFRIHRPATTTADRSIATTNYQQPQHEDPARKLQKYVDLRQNGLLTEEKLQKLNMGLPFLILDSSQYLFQIHSCMAY